MILPLSDCHMEMLASTVYMLPKLNVRNSSELCFVLRRKDGAIGRRRRRSSKASQKVRLNTSNTCIINRFFLN
jgi:hypothetical protein